jgi:xylulokinase
MIEAVLGVDAGTGALKAGLFGLDGSVLGLSRASYAISSPEPDAREQDPREWWQALATVCRDLGSRSRARILAVAIAGQAPTLAPVDANLEPTHPAITWLDPRTSADAERLYSRLGQLVPVWGSWPGQAAWFLRHRPAAAASTRWLLGCPDYLTSRLICRATALLPVTPEELEAGELDGALFPPAWTPATVLGQVTPSAADETGLPAGTPVVGGHVDGLLGVLGSGVRQPGDACINCGTSGTFSVVAEPPLGYPLLDLHIAGTASNTSGAALDWFMRLVRTSSTYAEVLSSADAVAPGADGLLFLPHLAGERGASSDAYARGAWVGLTLGHDQRHLLRALLEGVAFSFRSMQDWLESSGVSMTSLRCVGGQAHSDLWNQIKADVLNRSLLVPSVVETVVVGAALLAAVGIGRSSTLSDAVRSMVHVQRRFDPDPARAERYTRLFESYCSVYPALRETNWKLHELA